MENDYPYISFTDAAALPWLPRRRGHSKLNVSTLFRWSRYGIRGIRLQYRKVGNTPVTTEQWMREFFDQLADNPAPAVAPTPKRRAQAADSAMHTLASAGIR